MVQIVPKMSLHDDSREKMTKMLPKSGEQHPKKSKWGTSTAGTVSA
jgi:hypothetical protein